jgi:sec-independent protein translocase protein TatA
MFGNVGMGELLVVLVIMLLLFGGKRLPEVAKGLGRSIKAFKDGMNEPAETPSSESKLEHKDDKHA